LLKRKALRVDGMDETDREWWGKERELARGRCKEKLLLRQKELGRCLLTRGVEEHKPGMDHGELGH